jgi:choice-of-anchor C domain-containing protein
MRFASLIIVALAAFAVPAHANLVTNGSFEAGAFGSPPNGYNSLTIGSTVITGWTVFSDQIAWIDNVNPFSLSAQDGSKFLDLQDPANTGSPFGGVTQTISTTTGQAYRLTFYIGALESNTPDPNLGGPVTIQASAGATSMNFTFTPPANSGMQWMPFDLAFTATSSSTAISLLSIAGENFHGLDNVSVVAVPEAQAWLLMAVVAAGACVVQCFRRVHCKTN